MLSSSDTSESGTIFIDSMELRYLVDEGSSTTSDHGKPWATVLGATILVNLATIVGILFLVPLCRQQQQQTDDPTGTRRRRSLLGLLVPSFAAGALIATALFLTIPESIALIQQALEEDQDQDHQQEHSHRFRNRYLAAEEDDHGFEILAGTIWRFASSVLAGFLFPIVTAIFFPSKHHHNHDFQEREIVNGMLVSANTQLTLCLVNLCQITHMSLNYRLWKHSSGRTHRR